MMKFSRVSIPCQSRFLVVHAESGLCGHGAILLLSADVLTSTVAADNNLATPRNRVSHLQYLPILLA